MNEQQLQCFACVAEHLNFAKAAEELFLTASTVTHHIQSLESELDTKLFIRTTRSVQLTEAGAAFYPDVREILTRLELSKKHIQKAETNRISIFHIGCVSYSEFPHIRPVLTKMQQAFPNVRPMVAVDDYFSLKKMFENKQTEILIITKQMANEIKGGTFRKIRTIKNFALIPENFSCHSENEFSITADGDYCLIAMHPRFVPFQNDSKLQHDILLYRQNHDFISCEDEQSAVLFAQSGYGIAVLPDFLLPNDLSGLKVLPIKDSAETDLGLLFQSKDAITKFFMEEYISQIIAPKQEL